MSVTECARRARTAKQLSNRLLPMNKEANSNDLPVPEPLVEVRRGAIIESRHRGYVVAVEGDGQIIAQLGESGLVTYLRSSAKPFQVAPLIVSGAADRFEFTDREIALACGSHSGEPVHVETVKGMLEKIKLDETWLKCGTHEPFSREVARELRARGERPGVLQNNCSGKHTGMLALALHLGAEPRAYDQPDNPVQIAIANTIARFADVAVEDIAVGVDGCGVPVFGVTMRQMALMYARLVAPPADFDEQTRRACERIVGAMTTYPEIIGGTSERLDTELMRAARGGLVSKVGAEGVYTAGVLPCEEWPRGLGLALKIEDGEDKRGRPTVVIESLRQLNVLRGEMLEAVTPYARFAVKNHRGDEVGEVKANFNLNVNDGS
ncbi:MAG: asparaginase [Pyrinomonadaceae bacterium]|nr:asparaginase [Pyrinomonadaceae bacterium]